MWYRVAAEPSSTQDHERFERLAGRDVETSEAVQVAIHLMSEDVTAGEKFDDYEALGVAHTATAQEIDAAFQKLVEDFHAAGKPKNIDDVEWLRRVVHAHHALTDNSDGKNGGVTFGYDSAALEDMNRGVNNEIARQKLTVLRHVLGDSLGEIVWGYFNLRKI